MGPKTVEQYLIEKLEELPDAIQHILYEHGDQVAAAYRKIAAYLAYLESYVDSLNDLPEDAE